jgi:hypothetical protein
MREKKEFQNSVTKSESSANSMQSQENANLFTESKD